VRYEAYNPKAILFAAAPAFFDDDCPYVPDENIINFVNTEVDAIPDGIREVLVHPTVQFDIIPFIDVALQRFLPRVFVEPFVGSYKGRFFVLYPDGVPSASFFANRQEIIDGGFLLSLDFLDPEQTLDPTLDSYFERFISAHDCEQYEQKIYALYKQNSKQLEASGFESFTSCNGPGNNGDLLCAGFCPLEGHCSSGEAGEPCSFNGDCRSDWCATSLDGWNLVSRCKADGDGVAFFRNIPVVGGALDLLFGWFFEILFD
jgi:hypothetical protein